MSLEYVAPGLMQPRNHNQFVSHFHSEQCFRELQFNLEPCVRRAFRSLPRRVLPALHCRSDETNGLESIRGHSGNVVHLPYDATVRRQQRYPNSNVVTPKISASGSSGIGPSTIRAQPKTSLIL